MAGSLSRPGRQGAIQDVLQACILPVWGETRLDHVTVTGVKTWLANMKGGNGQLLSASRRRQAYHLLGAVLDVAVQDHRMARNPARPRTDSGRRSNFLPPLAPPKQHRYLTHHDVSRLSEACDQYSTLILVMAYGGLRWGEAVALRVDDVDELRGRLCVDETLVDVGGHLSFGTPKTHATRTVALPSFLRETLGSLIDGKSPTDLLFVTASSTPLRYSNWRRMVFDPAIASCGWAELTPHALRHTAASLAVSAGANVKAIQRMLGHKDAAMTLNTYADLFEDDLDEVAKRVDEAVSRARADLLRTNSAKSGLVISPPAHAQGL